MSSREQLTSPYVPAEQQPSKVKTAREKLHERIVSVIHPFALVLINSAADEDGEFQKVEQFLDNAMFDSSDVPHYIEWGPREDLQRQADGDPVVLLRPALFNSGDFLHKWRVFSSRARRIARRVHMVAFWVLDKKNMLIWLMEYLKADASAKALMSAPFGVIEPTQAVFYNCRLEKSEMGGAGADLPMTRLEVDWPPLPNPARRRTSNRDDADAELTAPRGVLTFVHADTQMNLFNPNAANSLNYVGSAMRQYRATPVMSVIESRFGGMYQNVSTTIGGQPMVIPNTPLLDLIELKARIKEAQLNLRQAEGQLVQGHMVVTVESARLNNNDLSRVPEHALARTTQTAALLEQLNQVQRYTHDEWKARRDQIERMINPRAALGGTEALTSSERARLIYDRPHPHERILDLSEGLQLAHVHKPEVLVDLAKLEEDYRRGVGEALGLGLSALAEISGHHTAGGSGNLGNNFANIFNQVRETEAERKLQQVIQSERNWVSTLFDRVYALMMNAIDLEELDKIHDGLRQSSANMREAKQATKIIEDVLQRQMDESKSARSILDSDPEVRRRYFFNKEMSRSKEERRVFKLRAREVRALSDKLRSRPDAYARLVFQPGTTERSARQLQILLQEFYDRGIVDAGELAKFTEPVFGRGLKIITNPIPPPTAAPLQPTEVVMPAHTATGAKRPRTVTGSSPDSGEPAEKKRKKDA